MTQMTNESETLIKLNVKELTGGQYFVEVNKNGTILDLKHAINKVNKELPPIAQRLIFSGRELSESQTILHYAIEDGKTIHLVKRKVISNNNLSIQASNDELQPLNGNRGDIEDQYNVTDPLLSQNSIYSDNNIDNNSNNNNNNGIGYVDVMELSKACKLIRLFAIIDCILMILFAFWGDLLFLVGVPLALCGYIGAKNLKRGALAIYCVFILLSVAFRIYLAYYYTTWLMVTLTVISVLLELYVFRQTINVFKTIPQLNEEDRRLLQQISSFI